MLHFWNSVESMQAPVTITNTYQAGSHCLTTMHDLLTEFCFKRPSRAQRQVKVRQQLLYAYDAYSFAHVMRFCVLRKSCALAWKKELR
jgi:hypothetical protein